MLDYESEYKMDDERIDEKLEDQIKIDAQKIEPKPTQSLGSNSIVCDSPMPQMPFNCQNKRKKAQNVKTDHTKVDVTQVV